MSINQTTISRVEYLKARLAEKREKAAIKYDRFTEIFENESNTSLPSVSLRAMLERVKLNTSDGGATAANYS